MFIGTHISFASIVDNDQLKNRNTEYWYDCYDCYLQERSLIKCQVLLSLCEPVWTALVVSVRRSVRIAGDVSLEYKLQLPCYSHFPPISMHQVWAQWLQDTRHGTIYNVKVCFLVHKLYLWLLPIYWNGHSCSAS